MSVSIRRCLSGGLMNGKGSVIDESFVRTHMVKLNTEQGVSLQITSLRYDGFLINENIRIIGPMVIFPKSVFSWNIGGLSDLDEKSLLLFKVLQVFKCFFSNYI